MPRLQYAYGMKAAAGKHKMREMTLSDAQHLEHSAQNTNKINTSPLSKKSL
jgi:hypothetical protein